MPLGTAALLALGGAALGAGKHFAMDVPAAQRQNKLAAETLRNSPWTGLTPNKVEQPNGFGSIFQGLTGGLAMGQGIENNASNLKFQDAVKESLIPGGKSSWSQLGQNPFVASNAAKYMAPSGTFGNGGQGFSFGNLFGR